MGNGNSNPNFLVMQAIAKQTNEIHLMVNKIGKMSAEQAKAMEAIINITNNLTGLSMLLHCMQTAQLEVMEASERYEVMEVYYEFCKKYDVKPLTGVVDPEEGEGE